MVQVACTRASGLNETGVGAWRLGWHAGATRGLRPYCTRVRSWPAGQYGPERRERRSGMSGICKGPPGATHNNQVTCDPVAAHVPCPPTPERPSVATEHTVP
eukprot:708498-Prymnesium_polylepis.1